MTNLTPDLNSAGGLRSKSAPLKNHIMAEVIAGRYKPGSRLPTENELCEAFEVSRPTVRRALAELEGEGLIRREQGRGTFVSEKTQPHAKQTSDTYAMVISGANDLGGLAMIRGFEQACRTAHHNMLLYDSENNIDQQGGLLLRLSHLDVKGVAINPVVTLPTPDYHIRLLHDRNIPVVFCHRGVPGVDAPVLSVSHEEEGRLVGKSFSELGHRRVALVIGIQAYTQRDKWVRGMREGLQGAGDGLPDEFIFSSPNTSHDYGRQEAELTKALEVMLRSDNPPTGIFAVPDDFSHAVECVLQRMGLRVPEDISLIGLGDANREGAFTRRLTSVVIDGADMSRKAVQLLDEIVSGKRGLHDTEQIAMAITRVDGFSLGPAPRNSVRLHSDRTTKGR